MTNVGETHRSVLAVGVPAAVYARIDQALHAGGYYTEHVVDGHAALDLAVQLPYDVVLVACPLVGVTAAELAKALRRPTSASLRAAIVLIAQPAGLEEATELIGNGANQVLEETDIESTLAHELARLLNASPRIDLRTVTRLRVQLGWGAKNALCQTVNLSATGMFVRTDLTCPAGTSLGFELTLPGETAPIRGEAKVVRQVTGDRGRVSGLGLRFAAFSGGDQARFGRWLSRHHR